MKNLAPLHFLIYSIPTRIIVPFRRIAYTPWRLLLLQLCTQWPRQAFTSWCTGPYSACSPPHTCCRTSSSWGCSPGRGSRTPTTALWPPGRCRSFHRAPSPPERAGCLGSWCSSLCSAVLSALLCVSKEVHTYAAWISVVLLQCNETLDRILLNGIQLQRLLLAISSSIVTTLYVLSPSLYTATKRKLSSRTKQLFYLLMFMDTFLTAGQLHEHLSCYLTLLLTTTPSTLFTTCHGHFTSNLLTKQALHPRG
jgi:hypothetical protein